MPDLTDTIEEVAQQPFSATVDGKQATQHSLKQLIDADQYLRDQTAVSRSTLPIRLAQLNPGGSV